MRLLKTFLLLAWLVVLSGCALGVASVANPQVLERQATWAVLPLVNHTETPQAALAAEALAEHQLRALGVTQLLRYPAALTRDSLFEPNERKVSEEARQWARQQQVRYALVGSVNEWRYKVGIDGEPAVGLSLQVIDLQTGAVAWSASGARSGWSRQAVSAVAQTLLAELLGGLRWPPVASAG